MLRSHSLCHTLYLLNNFIHFTMPYIIAVLVLVILGTGYTLFEKKNPSSEELATNPLVITGTSSESTTIPLSDIKQTKEAATQKTEDLYDDNPSESDSREEATATPTSPTPTPAATPVDNNTYTNGTYYATKSYRTPDGTYQMNVSVTIKDDKVTASTLSFDADGARDSYSKRFTSGYQSQVIGQTLEGFSLSRVGGASLTTNAFNSAVSSIRSQAS